MDGIVLDSSTDTEPVSQRGVVFLRDQDVTPHEMKDLMLRITELAGCVSSPRVIISQMEIANY